MFAASLNTDIALFISHKAKTVMTYKKFVKLIMESETQFGERVTKCREEVKDYMQTLEQLRATHHVELLPEFLTHKIPGVREKARERMEALEK